MAPRQELPRESTFPRKSKEEWNEIRQQIGTTLIRRHTGTAVYEANSGIHSPVKPVHGLGAAIGTWLTHRPAMLFCLELHQPQLSHFSAPKQTEFRRITKI
ncbi:Phosphatase and actin regulator 4, partial [Ophiophagus hannah]